MENKYVKRKKTEERKPQHKFPFHVNKYKNYSELSAGEIIS